MNSSGQYEFNNKTSSYQHELSLKLENNSRNRELSDPKDNYSNHNFSGNSSSIRGGDRERGTGIEIGWNLHDGSSGAQTRGCVNTVMNGSHGGRLKQQRFTDLVTKTPCIGDIEGEEKGIGNKGAWQNDHHNGGPSSVVYEFHSFASTSFHPHKNKQQSNSDRKKSTMKKHFTNRLMKLPSASESRDNPMLNGGAKADGLVFSDSKELTRYGETQSPVFKRSSSARRSGGSKSNPDSEISDETFPRSQPNSDFKRSSSGRRSRTKKKNPDTHKNPDRYPDNPKKERQDSDSTTSTRSSVRRRKPTKCDEEQQQQQQKGSSSPVAQMNDGIPMSGLVRGDSQRRSSSRRNHKANSTITTAAEIGTVQANQNDISGAFDNSEIRRSLSRRSQRKLSVKREPSSVKRRSKRESSSTAPNNRHFLNGDHFRTASFLIAISGNEQSQKLENILRNAALNKKNGGGELTKSQNDLLDSDASIVQASSTLKRTSSRRSSRRNKKKSTSPQDAQTKVNSSITVANTFEADTEASLTKNSNSSNSFLPVLEEKIYENLPKLTDLTSPVSPKAHASDGLDVAANKIYQNLPLADLISPVSTKTHSLGKVIAEDLAHHVSSKTYPSDVVGTTDLITSVSSKTYVPDIVDAAMEALIDLELVLGRSEKNKYTFESRRNAFSVPNTNHKSLAECVDLAINEMIPLSGSVPRVSTAPELDPIFVDSEDIRCEVSLNSTVHTDDISTRKLSNEISVSQNVLIPPINGVYSQSLNLDLLNKPVSPTSNVSCRLERSRHRSEDGCPLILDSQITKSDNLDNNNMVFNGFENEGLTMSSIVENGTKDFVENRHQGASNSHNSISAKDTADNLATSSGEFQDNGTNAITMPLLLTTSTPLRSSMRKKGPRNPNDTLTKNVEFSDSTIKYEYDDTVESKLHYDVNDREVEKSEIGKLRRRDSARDSQRRRKHRSHKNLSSAYDKSINNDTKNESDINNNNNNRNSFRRSQRRRRKSSRSSSVIATDISDAEQTTGDYEIPINNHGIQTDGVNGVNRISLPDVTEVLDNSTTVGELQRHRLSRDDDEPSLHEAIGAEPDQETVFFANVNEYEGKILKDGQLDKNEQQAEQQKKLFLRNVESSTMEGGLKYEFKSYFNPAFYDSGTDTIERKSNSEHG